MKLGTILFLVTLVGKYQITAGHQPSLLTELHDGKSKLTATSHMRLIRGLQRDFPSRKDAWPAAKLLTLKTIIILLTWMGIKTFTGRAPDTDAKFGSLGICDTKIFLVAYMLMDSL